MAGSSESGTVNAWRLCRSLIDRADNFQQMSATPNEKFAVKDLAISGNSEHFLNDDLPILTVSGQAQT
jgi:hypothetical protein